MPQAETRSRTIGQQETNMNLDKTSHPDRPEELVSSRYAVQIGEIEVVVISDGVLPLPTKMLGHNAAPAARAAWLDDATTLSPSAWMKGRMLPC